MSESGAYSRMSHRLLVKLGKWVDTAYVTKSEGVEVTDDEEVTTAAVRMREEKEAEKQSAGGGGGAYDVIGAVAGPGAAEDEEMMRYLQSAKEVSAWWRGGPR